MLDALKFVKGAVGTKDFVPALTHFHIAGGRVTGFNGKLSLCSPIALDIDCAPKATAFVAAIEACKDTVQLNMTASGKLRVRSGAFSAHVACIDSSTFPLVLPQGERTAMTGPLLPALAILSEFTADDASRPWAAGVLLDGHNAYATNNVIIVQHWLQHHFPYRLNVPRATVREMLRIGEEPVAMQATAHSITFHYSGERWLHSALNSMDWPQVDGLFDHATQAAQVAADAQATTAEPSLAIDYPLPDALFNALDTLAPFLDAMGQVWLSDAGVATAQQDGASVAVPGGLPAGSYNARMLALLRGVATHAALAAYPSPVIFYGANLRGVIAGMRSP